MIAVAGATGGLGTKVVRSLIDRRATVRAFVRQTPDDKKVATLRDLGAEIIQLDLEDTQAVAEALKDVSCVVSTLSGLHDVIVDAQSRLLEAAVAAGVPRFIPSDFACDFTKLSPGENRNLDLRREFHGRLDRAAIRSTSIFNGAFADMLTSPQSPFFDFEARRVQFWGSADQLLDFTTMDDTAAFTAAAAIDSSTPKFLRIAGDQISARRMAEAATAASCKTFELVRLGSIDDLAEKIRSVRAADPESEKQVFPPFQGLQYVHNMLSGRAKLENINNDRYPDLTWTRVSDLLAIRENQNA